jgi:hypothetical protein
MRRSNAALSFRRAFAVCALVLFLNLNPAPAVRFIALPAPAIEYVQLQRPIARRRRRRHSTLSPYFIT